MSSPASMTQLPPSPEMKGLAGLPPMEPMSLDGSHATHPSTRLRSVARYQTFQPRALACSSPIPSSYTGLEPASTISKESPAGSRRTLHPEPGMTSLGAVAGAHGVALFRLTKPHIPILILSHASNSLAKIGAVTSLSFQPDNSRSMHLAAARGSGVMIWDVSGHVLSPLCGRLGVDSTSGVDDDSVITSLAWQPSSDGSPWLAATTASAAGLWDLREPSGYSLFKPSLRFGVARKGAATNAPYVQVACSSRDECAILDAAGTLRVFDTRMTDRTRMSNGALSSFSSFQHAGVGLAHMPSSSSDDTCWVAWGLETRTSHAVVKIWKSGDESADTHTIGDDYWLMDGSPERPSSALKPFGYRLAGKCTTPNLACARVCPSPVESSIVTVGLDVDESDGSASWRADLWKLEASENAKESKLVRVVAFNGGAETDKQLASMLGKDSRQGMLRASELALSSYPTVLEHSKNEKSKGTGHGESESEFGLLLCNLSEQGYVTTHVIPEALPRVVPQKDEKVLSLHGEGVWGSQNARGRVFPAENEVAIKDVARMWGSHEKKAVRTVSYGLDAPDVSASQVAFDGGMPFDMEIPVAYSIASGGITGVQLGGVNELTSKNVPPIGANHSEDTDQTGADARAAAALMENIDADRIPCPRLCGATFGPGVGGLVTFHNGEVGKMWQWYQHTDANRLSAVPGLIGEPSLLAAGNSENQDGAADQMTTSRQCPRSLQDLIDMTTAAKEAQWGEQEKYSEGGSTAGVLAMGINFFEDDSDSSSDLPDDEFDDLGDAVDSKYSKGLYDSYFGDARRPGTDVGENSDHSERKSSDRRISSEVVGPSSDTLTPVVRVSHEFDRLALNNQNVDLARAWTLGELDTDVFEDFVGEGAGDAMVDLSERSRGPVEGFGDDLIGLPGSPQRPGLPRYRALVPSPEKVKSLHRVSSSPMLASMPMQGRPKVADGDEAGVHGGKYSIRPNESMVFLRKLFTHQQEGGRGLASSLRSPPDSPMLPNSLEVASNLSTPLDSSLRKIKRRPSKKEIMERKQIGVYILRTDESSGKSNAEQELGMIKQACLHNSNACRILGESEKGEVWEILSHIVDTRLSELGDAFDGWGGGGRDALGAGLVDTFLRYFESLGDVQMLSTMICVLRGSRGKTRLKGHPRWSLLSKGHDEKYDRYIRLYADLLYGWGALSSRAELNKHLVRVLPQSEAGQAAPGDVSVEGRSPGIALVFTCPQCGNETEFGTNVCRSCQVFAFRCGLCDQGVRGLFTVCESCGHGGHVDHMQAWFESHTECPSACGCNCTFVFPGTQTPEEFQAPLPVQ